jgi:RNA polymerase sigma-70 factor (ECF subfamily)
MEESRTNEQWIRDLSAAGGQQEAAINDLRDLLLRAALYFFSRHPGDLAGLNHEEILQRAEDCAQDALLAVIAHLADFRGDSRFTTWAYKFAINTALMSARRERWKGVSLDEVSASADPTAFQRLLRDRSTDAPEQSVMQGELSETILSVIETDLTEKQRQVLLMLVFHDVPLDEAARHFRTNRNAIYKLLHDARRKLKSGLQAHGFETPEALNLFSGSG